MISDFLGNEEKRFVKEHKETFGVMNMFITMIVAFTGINMKQDI